MNYKIYQLNSEFIEQEMENGHVYPFVSHEDLEKHGLKVQKSNYDLKYEGEMDGQEIGEVANKIYEHFQWRVEGFRGHSLSTSDVVEIEGIPLYCDSLGWYVLENEWN